MTSDSCYARSGWGQELKRNAPGMPSPADAIMVQSSEGKLSGEKNLMFCKTAVVVKSRYACRWEVHCRWEVLTSSMGDLTVLTHAQVGQRYLVTTVVGAVTMVIIS